MAYSTLNPPVQVRTGGTDGTAPAEWQLLGTDTAATVDTAGYITNGAQLGMKVNDTVVYTKTDSTPPAKTSHNVISVNLTTGAVDLGDGVVIGNANTD